MAGSCQTIKAGREWSPLRTLYPVKNHSERKRNRLAQIHRGWGNSLTADIYTIGSIKGSPSRRKNIIYLEVWIYPKKWRGQKCNKGQMKYFFFFCFIYLFIYLHFERRVSSFTTWATPPSLFCLGYFWDRVLPFLHGLWFSYLHLQHSWDDRCAPPHPTIGWDGILNFLTRLTSNQNIPSLCLPGT
jgi:hypothetical protein